jgi:hypothetical protein
MPILHLSKLRGSPPLRSPGDPGPFQQFSWDLLYDFSRSMRIIPNLTLTLCLSRNWVSKNSFLPNWHGLRSEQLQVNDRTCGGRLPQYEDHRGTKAEMYRGKVEWVLAWKMKHRVQCKHVQLRGWTSSDIEKWTGCNTLSFQIQTEAFNKQFKAQFNEKISI